MAAEIDKAACAAAKEQAAHTSANQVKVLEYDQSGHTPNITPLDQHQGAPHGKKGYFGVCEGIWTLDLWFGQS